MHFIICQISKWDSIKYELEESLIISTKDNGTVERMNYGWCWAKEEKIPADFAAKEDYNGQDAQNRTLIRINCVQCPKGTQSIDRRRDDIPIN